MEKKEKVSKYNYLFMMGHICTDISQGGLPAMLPFLIAEHGFTYAKAAVLILAANLVSTIVQPLFGYLGDKIERPWYMSLGILMSGVGISLIGLFENFTYMCIAVVIMGTGVALFHPEGSKMSNMVSGNNKGMGMSIFSVGGNVGFALGPIITSFALLTFGMKGSMVFLIPTTIMAIVMLSLNKKLEEISKNHIQEKEIQKKKEGNVQKDNWKGFSIVAMIIFFRSIIGYGMNTFLPLFFIGVLMQSVKTGNLSLSIFSVAGAIATLVGGKVSDTIGFKKTIILCSVFVPPLFFFFSLNRNIVIAFICIIVISLTSAGCHSVLIVMGQNFMPNRIGMASGILFGLTVSIGGMCAPLIGKIGDAFGLEASMMTFAIISLIVLILGIIIPKENKYHKLGNDSE